MRIYYIITGLSTGGAEMMLLKLLERLNRQRFSPSVISLTTLGEIGPRISALGIPVLSLGMNRSISALSAFVRLRQILKEQQPDIVHTWMYHADLLGGLAARWAGIPTLIWCLRNSNLDRDKTRWTTRLVVKICALLSGHLPQCILSCSEQAKKVHADLGYEAKKMHVIPNGFDLSRFRPDPQARRQIRTELGVSEDTPLAGLIGRFDPQKNHIGFVRAMKKVQHSLPQAHFLFAGLGVDEKNRLLTDALASNGLSAQTHLLGLRQDVPALMAALDVLALASSYGEAFPNVLGEAMACGVPCVTTDIGDSALIVAHTGRVVPPDDMTELAAAIKELLTLPAREKEILNEMARARVAEHFEIGLIVKRYEAFYENLLTRSKCI